MVGPFVIFGGIELYQVVDKFPKCREFKNPSILPHFNLSK